MKFFKFLVGVFKSYSYWDAMFSIAAVAVIALMLVKMIIFPYGFFGFGKSHIYTEGIISKTGIQNINPLFVDYNEADREVSSLVFSGLMKYDPAKKAVVDDMATLTINEDKTAYTFVLRSGLKWSDGESLTIDDVYFTFHDMILDPAFSNEILKTNFAGVKVEKVDEKTIRFTLEKPNIFFVSNMTTGILPQHILKNVVAGDLLQDEFNKLPVGSGPYIVEEPVEIFSGGRSQIIVARNPNYYGPPSDIEYMRFIIYPTMDQLVEEMSAVNGVPKVTGKYDLDFKNDDRFELISYELPQYTAVFLNMDSDLLQIDNVRLALQKAVDKQALIAGLDDKIAVDTPMLELDQKAWIYQPSVEQAQGALKDAGFNYHPEDVNKEGIRYDKSGNALEFNLIARAYDEGSEQYNEATKVIGFLVDSWEKVGFNMVVEFLPEKIFKERVMARQYDLLFVGQNLGYNLDTYSYWHSTQSTPLGQNFSNYKTFQVDSLIEDLRSTFDPERREASLKELADKIKIDIPAIFLYRPVYFYATDGKVSGISMENVVFPSDRFAGIGSWKFEE